MNYKGTKIVILLALAFLLGSCQFIPATPTITPTTVPSATNTTVPTATSTTIPTFTPTIEPSPTTVPSQTPVPITFGPLVTLHMFDTFNGWAVDNTGKILHAAGGLSSFQDVTPLNAPVQGDPSLSPLIPASFFLDSAHAWLAYGSNTTGTLILYSSDSGITWLTSQALPVSSSGEPSNPTSLYFRDAQNGWMWAQIYPGTFHVYADVYATTDGGATWSLRYDSFNIVSNGGDGIRGSYSLTFGAHIFAFQTNLKGWAGVGSLYATQDGGSTWNLVADSSGVKPGQIVWNLPSSLPFVSDPYWYFAPPVFSSVQDGILLVLLYEAGKVFNPPGDMFDGLPVASFLVWTHDGGQTWTFMRAPALLGTEALLDGQTGWFLGKDSADPTATASLFFTTDSGATWTAIQTQSVLPLGSVIQFVDAQNGFASPPDARAQNFFSGYQTAQNGNYLFETTDGGTTWVQK